MRYSENENERTKAGKLFITARSDECHYVVGRSVAEYMVLSFLFLLEGGVSSLAGREGEDTVNVLCRLCRRRLKLEQDRLVGCNE